MSLQPLYIAGSSLGLVKDKKPFMIPEQAFSTLENAYVWRERVIRREGIQFLGRLRRVLTAQALGNTDGAGNFSGNIFTILAISLTEPEAEIEAGSVVVTVGAQVFTESLPPDGDLSNGGAGSGTINYITGALTIDTDPNLAGAAVTISFNYYPSLPVMGIIGREVAAENDEQEIFFDTRYAYVNSGGINDFVEYLPLTLTRWHGSDSQFFWGANYRGVEPFDRLLFVTNFNNTTAGPPIEDPIRYTDGVTWADFKPGIFGATPTGPSTNFLIQARILIPYYGRLVALNTWEGTGYGSGASSNYFNRARFSQIGNPLETTAADPLPAVDLAWRQDVYGRGGFIDAPTNEAIISAAFFKNTLIVFFERSTWQLRYVGEYGLPFLWERISSDFGSESQFSTILFDQGVLAVGDRAIVSSNAVNVQRIDEQIPDAVFNFRNAQEGIRRVHGIRDFQKELAYWCYSDSQTRGKFPNKTLLYNYRNNTYAIFRNNITAFGTFQFTTGILWDNLFIFWDDATQTWDDPDDQSLFPKIVIGNQQGFVHIYGYSSIDEQSLTIQDVDFTVSPNVITSVNHNLEDGELIYITDLLFSALLPAPFDLNNRIFYVQYIDADSFSILEWDGDNYVNTPAGAAADYIGNGRITLLPKLNLETKDFNPFTEIGRQVFLSYADFLLDTTPYARFAIEILVNSSPAVIGNMITGQKQLESYDGQQGAITFVDQTNPATVTSVNHRLTTGNGIVIDGVLGMIQLNGGSYTVTVVDADTFTLNGTNAAIFSPYTGGGTWVVTTVTKFYTEQSQYLWHRFYATCTGQFLRLRYTYDDQLMNQISTNRQNWALNAIALYVRPAGRNVF